MHINLKNNKIKVAIVALIDVDERILLSKRPDDKHQGGLWEFPGGKIEIDESPKDALMREIKEELSVDICCECSYLVDVVNYEYEQFVAEIYLYVCRKWQGIVISNENQKLKWVKKDKLEDFSMPKANAQLVNSLIRIL